MDSETRKQLYITQMRETGEVILNRQNAAWFILQAGETVTSNYFNPTRLVTIRPVKTADARQPDVGG